MPTDERKTSGKDTPTIGDPSAKTILDVTYVEIRPVTDPVVTLRFTLAGSKLRPPERDTGADSIHIVLFDIVILAVFSWVKERAAKSPGEALFPQVGAEFLKVELSADYEELRTGEEEAVKRRVKGVLDKLRTLPGSKVFEPLIEKPLGYQFTVTANLTTREDVLPTEEVEKAVNRAAIEGRSVTAPVETSPAVGELNELRHPKFSEAIGSGQESGQQPNREKSPHASVEQLATLRRDAINLNERMSEALRPFAAEFEGLLSGATFGVSPDLKTNQITVDVLNYVASRLERGFACPKESRPKDGTVAEEIPSALRCYPAPGVPQGVISFEHPKQSGNGKHSHGGFATWANLVLARMRKAFDITDESSQKEGKPQRTASYTAVKFDEVIAELDRLETNSVMNRREKIERFAEILQGVEQVGHFNSLEETKTVARRIQDFARASTIRVQLFYDGVAANLRGVQGGQHGAYQLRTLGSSPRTIYNEESFPHLTLEA